MDNPNFNPNQQQNPNNIPNTPYQPPQGYNPNIPPYQGQQYPNQFQVPQTDEKKRTKLSKICLIGLVISAVFISAHVLYVLAYFAYFAFSVILLIDLPRYVKEKNMKNTGVASGGCVTGCGTLFILLLILTIATGISCGVSDSRNSSNTQTTESDVSVSSNIVSETESESKSETDTVIVSSADESSMVESNKAESKAESKTESKVQSENSSKSESSSKVESLSEEEYLELVEEKISGTVGKGEKITEVKLDEKTLYINVDIDNAELHSGITVPKEDLAVSRASSITDKVLQLDTSFWNTVVVDFKNLGTVSRKKSEIVHGEYGDYFIIDYLDNTNNSNSESSSSELSSNTSSTNNNDFIETYKYDIVTSATLALDRYISDYKISLAPQKWTIAKFDETDTVIAMTDVTYNGVVGEYIFVGTLNIDNGDVKSTTPHYISVHNTVLGDDGYCDDVFNKIANIG